MIDLLFPMFAGICVTTQNSMNALLTPYTGPIGVSVLGFLVQSLLVSLYQLIRERKLPSLKAVPRVCWLSGLLATINLGVIAICVTIMGSAVTTCCSVAGQVIMSAFVDHFGLFGTARHRFSAKRIPGFVLILAGVLSLNLLGNSDVGNAPFLLLIAAVLMGAIAIVVRSLNHRASQIFGSPIAGGFINSVGGLIASLILFLGILVIVPTVGGIRPDTASMLKFPPWLLVAGVFGTGSLFCNILAYRKLNILYATVFMLIAQVATGIVMDIFVFHTLSAGKLAGIAIILCGVLIDKLLTKNG